MLRNRTLLAISLSVCAAYTGIGMVSPVRVLFAQAHGASLAIIGAMASAYLVSNFVFQYPSGWLADRWGRKHTTVTLSQEHSLSDGFSGSVFDKSPQSDNEPLEPSHLLSVTVVKQVMVLGLFIQAVLAALPGDF